MSLTDKQKYSMQKTHSKIRGIEFNLTFEEWITWWHNTGHYHERGCKKGQYLMARFNDSGPYELNNIFCCTVEQNNRDRHLFNPYVSDIMKKLKSKPIMTPEGRFNSKKDAAIHYGLDPAALSYRLNRFSNDFYYIKE